MTPDLLFTLNLITTISKSNLKETLAFITRKLTSVLCSHYRLTSLPVRCGEWEGGKGKGRADWE